MSLPHSPTTHGHIEELNLLPLLKRRAHARATLAEFRTLSNVARSHQERVKARGLVKVWERQLWHIDRALRGKNQQTEV